MRIQVITLLAAAGLLAGCNQSVETASRKFNELPAAVQKTVRAQAASAEIIDVSNTTTNGMQAYKVEFRLPSGDRPMVVVADNGTLLSSDFGKPAGPIERALTPTGAAGTPFSALPEPVQKTIRKQAPNAQVAKVSRHEENGRVIYEVEFEQPGSNPTIRVADDGTLVQNLQK